MAKDVTPITLNDEQQSMQALRQYGGYIISAIILALAGYFGWNYYQSHGGHIDKEATNEFAKIQASQQAVATLSEQNTDTSKQQLAEKSAALQKDIASFVSAHPDSAYAWQALMMQAKMQTDVNQTKEAVDTLKQATGLKLNDAGLQAITTIRYAEALIANKQLDEANTVLSIQLPASFDATKNELLGDIAMAKNDKKVATDFYQNAWQALETRNKTQASNEDRALLRLKMEDLGLSPKIPEELQSVVVKPNKSAIAASEVSQTSVPSATAASTAAPTLHSTAKKSPEKSKDEISDSKK